MEILLSINNGHRIMLIEIMYEKRQTKNHWPPATKKLTFLKLQTDKNEIIIQSFQLDIGIYAMNKQNENHIQSKNY